MSTYRYDAFISYRHVEPDRKWAKWLHTSLESYRTPRPLVARGVPPRLGRVFRDEEELPASADLSSEIQTALDQSQFLIVVCSPRTPESKWVNSEVARFRELRRDDRILALLIEGEPNESFPRALCEIRRRIVDEGGQSREEIEEVEPLAADVRPSRSESPRYLRRMARLRMLACLLGCRFDDLRQREQERRTRRVLAASSGLVMLVIALVALTAFALMERSRAEAKEQESRRRMVALYQEQGRRELLEGRPDRAAIYLSEAYKEGGEGPILRFLLARTTRQLESRLGVIRSHERQVRSVAFDADSRRIVTTSDDGTARIHDVESGEGLLTIEVSAGDAVFSPDGRFVATAGDDCVARTWNAQSGEAIWAFSVRDGPERREGDSVDVVRYSPNGRLLATGSWHHGLTLWDPEHGLSIARLVDSLTDVVAFSADGRRVLGAGSGRLLSGGALSVFDTGTAKPVASLGHDERQLNGAAFGPSGRRVVAGGLGGVATIWDVDRGETVARLQGHYSIQDVDYSPTGAQVVTVGLKGVGRVWDTEDGKLLHTLEGHTGELTVCRYSPDGSLILTASKDGTARLWSAETGQLAQVLTGHTGEIRTAGFSPDGALVATAGTDATVRLSRISTQRPEMTWSAHRGEVESASFSPDGTRVVTGSRDGGVRIWSLTSGSLLEEFAPQEDWVHAARFFRDGGTIVTGGRDKTARLLSTEMPELSTQIAWHDSWVCDAALSPDEKLLATVSEDGVAQVTDLATGKVVHEWSGDDWLRTVAFSPDGALVATGGNGPDVRIYDLATGEEARRIATGSVDSLCFTPDGTRIAVGGPFGLTAIVYDAATGEVLLTMSGHRRGIQCVDFSEDGTRLLTASMDGTARIWDATTGDVLAVLRGRGRWMAHAEFSPDDSKVVTATENTVEVWDVGLETRSPTEIGATVAEHCPYELRDGRVLPRRPAK